jgi:hypothetical protein
MNVVLKNGNMKKVNLWVYGLATVSSLLNIFVSNGPFEKVAWACSFIWSLSSLMLQIRVNELEEDNLDLIIEKEVNSVKSDTDETE